MTSALHRREDDLRASRRSAVDADAPRRRGRGAGWARRAHHDRQAGRRERTTRPLRGWLSYRRCGRPQGRKEHLLGTRQTARLAQAMRQPEATLLVLSSTSS